MRTCWFSVLLLAVAGVCGPAMAQQRLPVSLNSEPSPIAWIAPPALAEYLPPPVEAAPAAPASPAVLPGSKRPPITPLPRPGIFTIPPSGPGYYSLKDQVQGNYQEKAPKYPYPRFGFISQSFSDIDWSYLDDPGSNERDFYDCLKRKHLGENVLFTTGGEFRYRFHNEQNSRLSGVDNSYQLLRTRVYGDLMIGDQLRVYGEFLDARSNNQDLPPLVVDVDHNDILNLFAEARLFDLKDAPVWARVGRQELLYGSQRLISPLDFANTRRTFDAAKVYRHGEKLDLDVFVAQPVIPNPTRLDSVDHNQVFSGAYASYRPVQGQNIDLYYLNLDQTSHTPVRLGIPVGPFNVSTVGARYVGKKCHLLWDFEGDVQFGDKAGEPILAQAASAGAGWIFENVKTLPQVWLTYDYASGDQSPTAGTVRTFNQLFPFGHYYFGFLDLVGRQNIHDLNAQFALYPLPWITLLSQFHVFRLDSSRDALYSAGGVPLRRDPTGAAGNNVGQELDLVVNFHLTKHKDVLFNYSHLFAGDFLKKTGSGRSPDLFFVQYSYRW